MTRRPLLSILLIALAGFVWRVVYIFVWRHDPLVFGDGLYYQLQARALIDGHGFVEPVGLAYLAGAAQTAKHPPLFPIVLGGVSRIGRALHLGSSDAAIVDEVTAGVLSSLGVVLIGVVAKRLGGARAGIAAALLAAAYPALWVSDALIMSESMVVLTTAVLIAAVYAYIAVPSMRRVLFMGLALGLAVLARSEALALAFAIVMPLVLTRRGLSWRTRWTQLGAAGAVTIVVLAPWVVRNYTTFQHPVFLSSNLDSVFAGANCKQTYYGSEIGGWDISCNASHLPKGDESVVGKELRRRGLNYMHHHPQRIPLVMAARVGRTFELYAPLDDKRDEGRSPWTEWANVFMFFPVQILAFFGALRLRRAGKTIWPLVAILGVTAAVSAGTYGITRFRVSWDVASVVLAGVALAGLVNGRKATATST